MKLRPGECASCREAGRKGYCAPRRCYCGHDDCPAFASYSARSAPPLSLVSKLPSGNRAAWDEREEDSWLEKM